MLALVLFVAPGSAETFAVPTRDGVSLSTDVWLPTGAGPWPTILRRTPYGRALDPASVQAVNDLGYAFVSQDVRGRGDSTGAYRPFFDDAADGADTLGWMREQAWSDGHACMYGGSAESIVQLLLAGEGAEGLDCIQPFMGTQDLRRSLYPGGAWREELTTEWLASLEESGAEAELRANEADGPFWDPVRLDAAERGRTGAAMLLVAGFFDIFESELPNLPAELREAGGGEDVWLVLGPWTHGGTSVTTQGEVEFPDAVYTDFATDLFELYDWKLEGAPRPDFPAVRYVLSTFADRRARAESVWVEADTWPPPHTEERLYLGVDGLGDTPGGEPVALPVDPVLPVPSLGGGNLTTAAGVYDQAGIDTRSDVFVTATAARDAAATVTGNLSARIWAASATTDVDVIVRVEVGTPGGSAWLVADGVRRGRFVGGEDAVRPLVPGEPAAFDVDLGPVAVTLPPGHTLRIAVSGTLSPRYEPNPNEAVALSEHPTPVPTTLTLYRDAHHPSSVVVPLVDGTLGGVDAAEPVDTGDTGTPDDGGGAGKTNGCGCASRPADGGAAALIAAASVAGARRRRRPPSAGGMAG